MTKSAMKTDRNYIPQEFQGGHKLITWAAMQCLPEWQRHLWHAEQYDLADIYSLYGDLYYTRKEELGRFVELPDGSVPEWAIGVLRLKKNYGFAVDYWESPMYEKHEEVFVYFLKRLSECLATGNLRDAAQFAGTMAHHIEDAGVPAHAADHGDLEFVKDYLSVPKHFIAFPLHTYTELSPKPFLIGDYKPRLYGMTPEEAGANYVNRFVELTLQARSLLFPLAKCAYTRKDAKGGELRLRAAKRCAYAYADFMYTATCIGMQRFEEDDVKQLKVLKLTGRWPYRMTAWAPAPYFEPGPLMLRGLNLDMQRNPVPCQLLVQTKSGVHSKRFREALGSGAYFEYHYRLPAGVYSHFSTQVGIHAVLGAKRSINIEVRLDGATAFQDVACPGEPALKLNLDAHGCRDLQLIASGPWLTEPDGSDNHVVWAQPRMTR